MFEHVLPEQVGVSSSNIKEYIEHLEKNGLATHSVVMVRHGKVFYEAYWAPFHRDFLHRLYSQSKSYVSLAIGFLVQDGLLDIEKPIVSFFDEEITKNASETVKKQTVKDMLMMCTGFPLDRGAWFANHPEDRLKFYFDDSAKGTYNKVAGTLYNYDSNGSFVLCALVEEITGKSFDEFMHERLYSKIGVSEDTFTLKCPGGNSWGDSAILARAIDQAKMMHFTMRYGEWDGEQILDREYVKTATSALVDNNLGFGVSPEGHGYGYQIWRTRDNSFMFNGMGAQLSIGVPDKDLVFVINSDDQGIDYAKREIINGFFEIVANRITADEIPADEGSYKELQSYSKGLKLYSLKGERNDSLIERINGKEYVLEENPTKITSFKFEFDGDDGKLCYTNATGYKELVFSIGKNAFSMFPEEGYSDLVGNTFTPGNYYKCATSVKFAKVNRLDLLVQVIDKYFGRMRMNFSFKENGEVSLIVSKVAEDFMHGYYGWAIGRVKSE